MTRYSQGPEGAEISSIFQSNQAKWNNDKENSFFVDMPTEEKRCISAEGDSTNKTLPGRLKQEAD